GYPGQTYPGQTYPAQNYPTPDYPTPDYPVQATPTQDYPAQSYPAQSYPEQHGAWSGPHATAGTATPAPVPASGALPVPAPRRSVTRTRDADQDGGAAAAPARDIARDGEARGAGRGTDQDTGRDGDRPQRSNTRLAADRRTLRDLGVPTAWTRGLRGGDRFAAVVRMLDRMPDVELDADLPVVAVVGPSGPVQLEAHRTALDLHLDDRPRPVVVIPRDRRGRGAAIARSHRLGVCVAAVETSGYDCDEAVTETLQAIGADAVVAVIDASLPFEESQRWLDALGQVDAIAVDNAASSPRNAAPLQLGVPVVRLDGIPIDRITWAAVLCAQLEAASPAE
ncbi:MAG: hypothetical protein P8Z68_02295, partial [Kineosporiaceae bacterium]